MLTAVAGVLMMAGFVPYIRAILRDRHLPAGTPGKTAPTKASWIIWTTLDTITLAGMIAEGTVNGQMIGTIIGAYITVGLVLTFGKPGWTRLDKWCLSGAVLGITLWAITENPVAGITTSCVVLFLGSIPTFVSAWEDPGRENRTAWTLYWLGCCFSLAAVPTWTLANALQPITFAVIETIAMVILLVRPRMLARA